MQIKGVKLEICKLIHGYLTKMQKSWALIDQQFMIECIESWYGVRVPRSTLCDNLKVLVEAGILERVTRHHRNPQTGQFEPRVTLYRMTMKLRAVFLQWAAYFRGIGWRNHITAQVKRRFDEHKQAIEAASKAALPAINTWEEFKHSWRRAVGAS